MARCTGMNMMISKNTFKVKYISDIPSPYFKKGEVYDAYLPRDNKSGKFFVLYIGNDPEPGDYAFPSDRFEIVK